MRTFKRILALISICGIGIVSAQNMKVLEIQGGSFNPKGARRAGLIFGVNYGVCVDERIDLTLGLSMYRKSYSEQTPVDSAAVTGTNTQTVTVINPLEYSTTILPITASATVHVPFQPPLGFYFGGSVAYEFLFDKYTNYRTGEKDSPTFNGFGWMARAGVEYKLGSRSSITLEGFYNGCKVKSDRKKIAGIPSWKEVDISGFGFKAGLRLELY
jgi:hypothetical protein